MKQENDSQKLAALLRKLTPRQTPEELAAPEPVTQLVLSFLGWETTLRQAERAFEKLMRELAGVNDLRVAFEPELIQIIGPDYPLAAQRMMRLRQALNEIYLREHDVKMSSIVEKGKREQRAYLDSLPGVPPYVAAQVTLISFGGHAMPVDTKLVAMLAREGVTASGARPEQVESFLLRQIKADDALEAHLKFQAWEDASRVSAELAGPAAPTLPHGRTGEAAPTRTAGARSAKTSSPKKSAAKKASTKKKTRRTSSRAKKK